MPIKKLMIVLTVLSLLGIAAICIVENPPGPPPDPSKMEAEFKNGLDKLVAGKVITQNQEYAVIQYFQDMHKNAPPPQPSDNSSPNHEDPLSTLVRNGVITQDQAKAIEKLLPKPPIPNK